MNVYQNQEQPHASSSQIPTAKGRKAGKKEIPGIDVAIYDSAHPKGLIIAKHKVSALKKGLFEMMYRDLLSEADISPKFNWSDVVDGVFRFKAVDQHSAEFLEDIVERMPPPWENAKLYVEYEKPKVVVEAFVPGENVAVDEILHKITAFDNRILTGKWLVQGNRPLGAGYVHTFVIESSDFKVLNNYDGFIPFNGTQIEFRVLKNPDLIPKGI